MEKLKLTYSIKKEEWLEGYDLSYSLFRKKFTYIKAAVFLIPLLLFIEQLFRDPHFKMGYVCVAVCIGAIVCIFATPKMERRTAERALDSLSGDIYCLTLYEDRLKIETIIPEGEEKYLDRDENGEPIPLPKIEPTVIPLSDKSLRATETDSIIGVFTKAISCVIPKSGLNDNDLDVLKTALKI